jgi:hypothetical protein
MNTTTLSIIHVLYIMMLGNTQTTNQVVKQ